MGLKAGFPINVTTSTWGEEVVTIASNVGAGSDQECRYCVVCAYAGNTGVINVANTTATANDAEIPKGVPVIFPVSNTNLLNFYGGTDSDKVSIIWFN